MKGINTVRTVKEDNVTRPKIGIALSGGSALGYAHIGVLQALLDNGIDIDYVAGTSMGAIIGAMFVTGSDMEQIAESACKWRLLKFSDMTLNKSGMFSGKHFLHILKQYVPSIDIKDTKIPFKCVSADLLTGKQYVWEEGCLLTAVRSSMSVPGVFVPVKHGDMWLVDGGVVNNLPDDIVRDMGADIVLSFDAIGGYRISKPPKTAVRAMMTASYIMQSRMIDLKKSSSDIIVSMAQYNDKKFSFNKKNVKDIIKQGYNKTIEAMPEIKKIIERHSRNGKVMKPLVKNKPE